METKGVFYKMPSLKTYQRVRDLLKKNPTGRYTKVDIRDILKADYNSVKECLAELLDEKAIVMESADGIERYRWKKENGV